MWTFDLDSWGAASTAQDVLSLEEQARASRFVFEVHRRRFRGARRAMRALLGRYLACAPADVPLAIGANGRPYLPNAGLDFNLTHSEQVGALGLLSGGLIGVDVEMMRDVTNLESIAARHFSEAEHQEVLRRAGRAQQEFFFRCWTHKEAFLKATGLGLSGSLKVVEVPPEGEVRVRDQPQWTFQVFQPAAGCPGAVAVDRNVERWEWLELPHAP